MENELQNIIKQVWQLFIKYGIKSVSMDDVARELGISKKTLYQYVSDKEELIRRTVDAGIWKYDEFFKHLKAQNLNAIDELFEINLHVSQMKKENNPTLFYDLRKYYPEIYKNVDQMRRSRIYQTVQENLEKGITEGLYRSDLNIEIITKLHASRIENIVESDIFSLEELFSRDIFKEIVAYHLRGICSEKGVKYFERKINEPYKQNENE